ncbi:alpha/beta fold hydrolase [Pseudonocardia endophytica]|uniref:Pimeloyl-ACP methyl ester carboxylesterase n=1 Tax=Pseudonocardia endophytica TaxID=401976 RepID=A0A4R1I153_PSEEN|nr:alpha/beta hydrolase [Pseudonocardia endophytica]TCK27265.1 pimeloyl-ACP methyl ester carboxylesterase [Pseudonocardia endophytica]
MTTTYVLVHGGFVDGTYWAETAALLEKEGHRVLVADLPSTGTDPAELGDLYADATAVRAMLDTVDGPVVLVGHSYGGMVITEVADHPAIVRRVYLSAFWPAGGQSLLDLIGGELPPSGWIVPVADGAAVRVTDDIDVARETLAADVDPARFAAFHAGFLLSSASAMGVAGTAPERAHPVTYVVLGRDNAIPPEAQEAMAARADDVQRIPRSSHSPMLADPEGLASLLARLA